VQGVGSVVATVANAATDALALRYWLRAARASSTRRSRIELGERRVDLVELDTICGALGVSTISAVWRFLSDDT
jgi:hypothetical protein